MNVHKHFARSILLFLFISFLSFSKPPKHFDQDVHVHRNLSTNYLSTNGATINGPLYVSGTINNNGSTVPTALGGDVTGPFSNNKVNSIGGQVTAAEVIAATIAANTATCDDMQNMLVSRDNSGNFAANMITLDGTVTNSTDAATKQYVDMMAASGLIVKAPALVTSLSPVVLEGLPVIDGVQTVSGDRVLLMGQTTNPIENGLWLVQPTSWIRPSDFASGYAAGAAYVLILSGNVYAGTSWACSTPLAIIDTDPIYFSQFGIATQTTAANVGGQPGQFYSNKTGNTLNFRTLGSPDRNLTVATDSTNNNVTIVTNATNINTPNTIVARDDNGNIAGSAMNFFNGSNYVGLSAPGAIPGSYSVSLPLYPPIAGQILQANSVATTTWAPMSPSPTITKMYYVSFAGNDNNDGSLLAPFLTVKRAIVAANGAANPNNPVCINVGAGYFVEDNYSTGPLTIGSECISIIGASTEGTVIIPAVGSNDLFYVTASVVEFDNMSFIGSPYNTACAINQLAGSGAANTSGSIFKNLKVLLFQTGFRISCSEPVIPTRFLNINAIANGTAFDCSNMALGIQASQILGGSTPVNTGIVLSGLYSSAEIATTIFENLANAVVEFNGGLYSFDSCLFYQTIIGANCSNNVTSKFGNVSFTSNVPSSINLKISDPGTYVNLTGCLLSGNETGTTPIGIGIQVTNGAILYAYSCAIEVETVGIQSGTTGDSTPPFIRALSVGLTGCATDINQVGSSTLQFIGGTCDEAKVHIADSTNVNFAAFHSNGQSILSIGSNLDTNYTLYQVLNGQSPMPHLSYTPTYYGYKGTVYQSADDDTAINATQSNYANAANYVVTGDDTLQSSIGLISEPAANIGTGAYARGWEIAKKGGAADLAFTFSNADPFGLATCGATTVMDLNGSANQINFPVATNAPLPTNSTAKLVWGGDTDLYRSAAQTLKTDNNLTVGGLAPNAGLVHNDPTGLLLSSLITNTDIYPVAGSYAGITDDKLATIQTPNKVANSATSAVTYVSPNTIVLRDSNSGITGNAINANVVYATTFSGQNGEFATLYGNAATANTANSATNFTGQLGGDVQGYQGYTHVITVGNQLAGYIAQGASAANNAQSGDVINTIVVRDNNGNFSGGTITANQFSGPLSGNVTGNVSGNATSATTALTANSATNFTGLLSGNVTGSQNFTVVNSVGGASAGNIAAATSAVLSATSNDAANTIVMRDGSGDFATNQITINGAIINPTDATTKEYVDAAVSTGFVVHSSVVVVSLSDIGTPSGLITIDGVLLAANNRVLLNGQNDATQNGLWLAEVSTWARPTDFAVGTQAGAAYVLTTSGNTQAGSSWICTSTAAVIGTNPITFTQFGMPGQTTAANIGSGAGTLYTSKTGQTLNFKTIAAAAIAQSHISITNNADNVALATDATSANTPGVSTIIARDTSGNFSAGVMTGLATGNVSKTGDTMSGNLIMASQSAIRLGDATGNYVGLNAPAAVNPSYTVNLPPAAPATGQVLRATSASTTTWATMSPAPAIAKSYYVSLAGNDTTGDGSLLNPFRTIGQALFVANSVASLINPVAIVVGAGNFIENPLTISADGISVIGSSMQSTNVIPANGGATLFNITASNVQLSDLTLTATNVYSTACAVNQTTSEQGTVYYNNLSVFLFQTGFSINASTSISLTGQSPTFMFNNIEAIGNGTFFTSNNASVVINASNVAGTMDGTPANTGMVFTGTNGLAQVFSTVFYKLNTGASISGGGAYSLDSCMFDETIDGVVLSGGTVTKLSALTFAYNYPTSINIAATDSPTKVYVTGCTFDGQDQNGVAHGVAIQATAGATILASSCSIEENVVGIQTGTWSGETNETYIRALSVGISACTTDINQLGTSMLQFVGGTCNEELVNIANPTNVNFASFHSNGQAILSIGPNSDSTYPLLQVVNGQTASGQPYLPRMSYSPSYYGYKGTVFNNNTNTNSTFNATESNLNNAAYYVITDTNAQQAAIDLLSDQGGSHNGSNMRGWEIAKQGGRADLSFTYSNSDLGGYNQRLNTVMDLDGYDNTVNFPSTSNPTNATAKLVWGNNDTNVYGNGTGSLITDGNLTVGGLKPTAGVVHNNNAGLLSSSLIINNDVDPNAAIADSKLAQIVTTNKVANSATTAQPTVGANTIVSRDQNSDIWVHALNASTANITTVSGSLAGNATSANSAISAQYFTTALTGDVTGGNNQGAIVGSIGNNSMSAATIVTDCTLAANATSQNISPFGTIVKRDSSGNFSASTITASLTGAASLNVLKAGDSMTGALAVPAGSAAAPSLLFSGSTQTGLEAATANQLALVASGTAQLTVSTSAVNTIAPLTLTNVLCNQATQIATPLGDGNVVNCNSTTSILLLHQIASIGSITINFPPFPTNGQYFTILCGSSYSISITNASTDGSSIVNPVIMLSPGSRLDGYSGGCSVTYFYLATSNSWYCCNRG